MDDIILEILRTELNTLQEQFKHMDDSAKMHEKQSENIRSNMKAMQKIMDKIEMVLTE